MKRRDERRGVKLKGRWTNVVRKGDGWKEVVRRKEDEREGGKERIER